MTMGKRSMPSVDDNCVVEMKSTFGSSGPADVVAGPLQLLWVPRYLAIHK